MELSIDSQEWPMLEAVRPKLVELDPRVLPSFSPTPTFATGLISPSVAASADFNRDGVDDLAVFNSSGGTSGAPFISVLLSHGDGQFTQSAALDEGSFSSPTSIISADFNGDGIPDLASGSGSLATLRVFLGNGDGTFTQTFLDATGTQGLGSGDFNGDGLTDLVSLQNGQFTIDLSNGLGQFSALPAVTAAFTNSRILTGDIDGNGTVDFVSVDFSGNIDTYLGNGNGTFGAPVVTHATASIGDFALGLFDGDGRPDLVTLEGSLLVLHSNLGSGQFDAAGVPFFSMSSSGIRLASADFNSDGRADVVATDANDNAWVFDSNGDGTFNADTKNPYSVPFFDHILITGDFDGDHHPDFAAIGSGSAGLVYLSDLPDATTTTLIATPTHSFVGAPVTFTATVTATYPGHDTPLGTVTFTNGSTVLGTATLVNGVASLTTSMLPIGSDSITASYSGSTATTDASGFVVPRQAALLASQSATATVIIRDYDKQEFVVGSDNGSVACYHDGSGNLVHGLDNFAAPFPGVRPALGDFNGDGVSDIVAGSSPGITAEVTIVDGATLLPIFAVQPFDAFQGGVFVASADFNGDGIADFAVGADAGAGPRVSVYLTRNGALVRVASFNAFGDGFTGGVRLAAGDINGDGTPDLIVGAGAGAGPSVAVFDGTGLAQGIARRLVNDFYVYAPEYRGGVFVAAGDVNGDGYADIITGAGIGPQHVTVVDGLSLFKAAPTQLASFIVEEDENYTGGIRVAARDLNRDGFSDVIAGAGIDGGSTVWSFSGLTLTQLGIGEPTFDVESIPGLYAGVYVG